MKSVFISHSWHDKPLAKKLAGALQALGGRVWLDEAEIKLGDSLVQKIREGIDSVDFVIALLSRNSCSSAWVTKELDIAMNQEIEGRRVKVLPILASKCDLPSFLTGKLYADMSTARGFAKSLPSLLDRLDARPEVVARARSGAKLEKLSDAKWVYSLGEALATNDSAIQFKALKSAPTWRGKELMAAPEVLERVFDAVEQCKPAHVRLLALEVIASVKDASLGYRIEHLLTDTNPYIVGGALKALAAMESKEMALKVLEMLRSSEDDHVRRRCLGFFSGITLDDESVVMSLVSTCEGLLARTPDDLGLEILVIDALARQFASHPDEVLPHLLAHLDSSGNRQALARQFPSHPDQVLPDLLAELDSPGDRQKLAVLRALLEYLDEFYFRSPKLRDIFTEKIWHCCESEEPEVAANAWLIAILTADYLPRLDDRGKLWSIILKADQWAVEAWLDLLGNYKLGAVLDQPGDHSRFMQLVGKFDRALDSRVQKALAEIGTEDCLIFIADKEFTPEGWDKVHVLRACIRLKRWNSGLDCLLEAASQDLPSYTGAEGVAMACLALHKAGRLDMPGLLARVPTSFDGVYVGAEADHEVIANALRDLLALTPKTQGRKLTRAIRALRRTQDD